VPHECYNESVRSCFMCADEDFSIRNLMQFVSTVSSGISCASCLKSNKCTGSWNATDLKGNKKKFRFWFPIVISGFWGGNSDTVEVSFHTEFYFTLLSHFRLILLDMEFCGWPAAKNVVHLYCLISDPFN